MLRRLLLGLFVATALAGCETIQFYQSVTGGDYRPVLKTGTIKGTVKDRNNNPIVGARVTNGAVIFFTSDGGAKVTDDKGKSVTLAAGEFYLKGVPEGIQFLTAEYDGVISSRVQTFVNSGTFDSANPDAAKRGVTEILDIKLAVDGPVGNGNKSVQLTAVQPSALSGEVATSSAGATYVIFDGDGQIMLALKAPPNGVGETIRAYKVEYPEESSVSTTRELSIPVTVLPGSSLQSGPTAVMSVSIANTAVQLANRLTTSGQFNAVVKLYSDRAATQVIQNRDGEDLQARVLVQRQ